MNEEKRPGGLTALAVINVVFSGPLPEAPENSPKSNAQKRLFQPHLVVSACVLGRKISLRDKEMRKMRFFPKFTLVLGLRQTPFV